MNELYRLVQYDLDIDDGMDLELFRNKEDAEAFASYLNENTGTDYYGFGVKPPTEDEPIVESLSEAMDFAYERYSQLCSGIQRKHMKNIHPGVEGNQCEHRRSF